MSLWDNEIMVEMENEITALRARVVELEEKLENLADVADAVSWSANVGGMDKAISEAYATLSSNPAYKGLYSPM